MLGLLHVIENETENIHSIPFSNFQAKFTELLGLEKKLSAALQVVGGITTTRMATRSDGTGFE